MRSLTLLRFLIFMPLLAGCGLPDSYYLEPPSVPPNLAGSVSNNFEFFNPDHSRDLSVTFQGFDLYYQLYSDSISINDSAYDAIDINPPVTQLTSKGFLPVCRVEDSPPSRVAPAIPVATLARPYSFAIDVFVNFPADPNPSSYYTYTPPSTATSVTKEIRRNARDPNSGYGYKSFAGNSYRIITPPNYPDAVDMSAAVYAACKANGGLAYLAMYVMSYGLAGGTTALWSTPVYLGFLSIQIN